MPKPHRKWQKKKVKRLLFAGESACKGLIAGKLGTKKLTRGGKANSGRTKQERLMFNELFWRKSTLPIWVQAAKKRIAMDILIWPTRSHPQKALKLNVASPLDAWASKFCLQRSKKISSSANFQFTTGLNLLTFTTRSIFTPRLAVLDAFPIDEHKRL